MCCLFVALFICLSGLCKALRWGEGKEGTTQGSRLSPGLLPPHHPLLSQATNIITASLSGKFFCLSLSLLMLMYVESQEPLECLFVEAGLFSVRNVRKVSARVCWRLSFACGLGALPNSTRRLWSVWAACLDVFNCFRLYRSLLLIVSKCKCQISDWIFILCFHSHGSPFSPAK